MPIMDEKARQRIEEKSDFAKLPFLHIYSQPCPHFSAGIVGNRTALEMLAEVIRVALTLKERAVILQEVYATDGEGYSVRVKVLPDDPRKQPTVYNIWDEYLPHYCDYADKEE